MLLILPRRDADGTAHVQAVALGVGTGPDDKTRTMADARALSAKPTGRSAPTPIHARHIVPSPGRLARGTVAEHRSGIWVGSFDAGLAALQGLTPLLATPFADADAAGPESTKETFHLYRKVE